MTYTLRTASPAKTRADAVVVGLIQSDKAPTLAPGAEAIGEAYGRKLRGLLATLGATGKAQEITRLPGGDNIGAALVVFVGLGASVTHESVRAAAGAAARAIPNATSVALALPASTPALVSAVAEGFRLGGYTFQQYKSKNGGSQAAKDATPAQVSLLVPDAKDQDALDALTWSEVVVDAVTVVRDWVNTPPNDLTPPIFADAIVAATGNVPAVTAHVYAERALEKLGAGGILAVGGGSVAPPRLVELRYAPADATMHLALVGKGITFDSGGLNIKTGNGMASMKSDMAGAATVVQATLAIARLDLPIAVTAYAPIAENMISGRAVRPGDVITQYGGTTVEITNTDAEGRLVLADALVRATEAKPDVIVDVATLTGAMVMALGDQITGILGSDDVVADLICAGAGVGETHWQMPLPEAVVDRVKATPIADLLQADGIRWGGGLYAAAFLREFTGGRPWAHLDIAGPSWNGGGARGAYTAGGTGIGVATLMAYARDLALRDVDDRRGA